MNPVSAVMGALKYMPASVARKALEKVSPKFGNFFSRATAYGFDTDRLIEGISDKFKSGSDKDYENQLAKGGANQTLRPDEMASRSAMENRAIPGKIARSGIALAAGGLLGSKEENPKQQSAPQQPSPMSGSAMEQDVQAQEIPQDKSAFDSDMVQDDYSDILSHIRNRMTHGGRSLEQAAQEVGSHKQFRDKVMKIEQSGVKFMDWVRQQLGGQQGQGQQGSSGVDQAIMAAFEKIMSL